MTIKDRRDSFCGKMSVCNNLRQYRIPHTLTRLHTCDPDSFPFREDLQDFVVVSLDELKAYQEFDAKVKRTGVEVKSLHLDTPPEKVLGRRSARCETRMRASISSARRRRSGRGMPRGSPYSTLLRALMCGNSASDWKT